MIIERLTNVITPNDWLISMSNGHVFFVNSGCSVIFKASSVVSILENESEICIKTREVSLRFNKAGISMAFIDSMY